MLKHWLCKSRVKIFLTFLFIVFRGISSFGQCNALSAISPDSIVFDVQYITKDFIHQETCSPLTDYRYEFDDDCAPCSLSSLVELQSSPLYISVSGVLKSEVLLGDQVLSPIETYSDISYYLLDKQSELQTPLTVKVWLSNEIRMEVSAYNPSLDFEGYLKARLKNHRKHSLVTNLFLGTLFATFMISLSSFIFSKSPDFKWYSIYVFILFLFFMPRAIHSNEILGLENKDVQMIFQPLVYVFYNLFIISFLKISKKEYVLNFLLRAAMFMLGAFTCMIIVTIIFDFDDAKQMIWNIFRVGAIAYATSTIGVLIGTKVPLKIFIILGSLALIIGAALSMYFTIASSHPLGILPIHWMYYGTVLEVLIFYSGIGYRINLEHKEKLDLSQSLFVEMQKNKKLQEDRNEKLVKEVSEAESKVKREEKQRTKAEYELLLRNKEMQLLRAQMNPHFIYNSLNSIKSYIARNEPRKASEFLNKFAKLIRIILNNSNSSSTTIKQELETLRFYLEVEQLRLNDDFTFTILVDETLETINIPPLLIQPYVENAIWHGLVPKKGKKELQVSIEEGSTDMLKITVKDNGIGRLESMKFNSNVFQKNDSQGMNITDARVSHGSPSNSKANRVEILDHFDEDGNSLGTEVIILMKYSLGAGLASKNTGK